MKHKKFREDGEHEATISITIAKASILNQETEGDIKKAGIPQVQNYFHCEYRLLPEDRNVVETDVVTFGKAAKVYGDNDSKVLRTWVDGNKTWITWTSSRKIRVTQDLLLKMFTHKFELKMWDTKDKVSAKARFDRPKAFRLPNAKTVDEVDLNTIRGLIEHDGKEKIHLGTGATSLLQNDDIDAKKKVNFVSSNQELAAKQSSEQFIASSNNKLEVRVRLDENREPEFKNLLSLASTGYNPLAVDTKEAENMQSLSVRLQSSPDKRATSSKRSENPSRKSNRGVTTAVDDSENEAIRQNGLATITIPMYSLFTNCLSVSNTLKEPISTLEEVIVIITLERPLLSDHQRCVLNPMVLTVNSACSMPENGLSFDQMKLKCLPPYIKYTFHTSPEHTSEPRMHGKSIKFNDNNVVLLGTLSRNHLFECLRGPALKIEVHDRDPKEIPKRKASVFGSRPDDESICSVAYTGGRLQDLLSQNIMEVNYGVAEFDMSELLTGEKYLRLVAPIRKRNGTMTNTAGVGTSNRNCDESKFLSRGHSMGIPAGDYLGNSSQLKIHIQLARSLTETFVPKISSLTNRSEMYLELEPSVGRSLQTLKSAHEIASPTVSSSRLRIGESPTTPLGDIGLECPYSRIVYMFDYQNRVFLEKILTLSNGINSEALNLSSYAPHVIEAALSTYKLTDEQKRDKDLDIITGCQIIDGDYHVFILEGLTYFGIKKLWDTLGHPLPNGESFFRVLYNSDMTFAHRMYAELNVDLTRIRLHQPLTKIVKEPLLYVRDMIPKYCFQAVTRLFQLIQCTSLQKAVRSEILPSVPMIVSLGREFGVPLTRDDLHRTPTQNRVGIIDDTDFEEGKSREPLPDVDNTKDDQKQPKKLDMSNSQFDKMIKDRKNGRLAPTNFINANIKSLLQLSKERTRTPTITCNPNEEAFNHSTQALNSTNLAYEKLREYLSAEDGDARFTYCQAYNSATLEPISLEKQLKLQKTESKQKWRTESGFVLSDFKSSIESNRCALGVPSARTEELYKPWRENVLHANKLKPTVDRMLFRWADRDEDFDTWTKPIGYFGESDADTARMSEDARRKDIQEETDPSKLSWFQKLVANDPQFKTHRCLVATELTKGGVDASNQIDKMNGLLKDDACKLTLKKRGMRLEPIPTIDVVTHSNEADETSAKNYVKNVGYKPGDLEHMSLLRDVNYIPIEKSDHERILNS